MTFNIGKIPTPPKSLKADGRAFWRKVLRYFELIEPQDLKRLEESCVCIDNIAEARKTREGVDSYYLDRFGQPRPHPSFKIESDNRSLLIRCLREIGLDLQEVQNPRAPTRPGGYS
jgi:phage terminase small subunit